MNVVLDMVIPAWIGPQDKYETIQNPNFENVSFFSSERQRHDLFSAPHDLGRGGLQISINVPKPQGGKESRALSILRLSQVQMQLGERRAQQGLKTQEQEQGARPQRSRTLIPQSSLLGS